jgi:hypothetical protein
MAIFWSRIRLTAGKMDDQCSLTRVKRSTSRRDVYIVRGLRLNFDDARHLETEMRTWQAFDWRTATMRDLQLESNRRGESVL